MQPMCFSARARLTVLLAMLLLVSLSAFARNGHDFAGYYSIRNVVDQGDHVRFTMHLTVVNHSDADVRNAVIKLYQRTGIDLAGQTQPIKLLKDHATVTLSQQFTVSKREYNDWNRGGVTPTMSMVYRAGGAELTGPIQLAPR